MVLKPTTVRPMSDRVYYYDGEGIKRMTLGGKELEIVSQMPATYLTTFNGTLYFINTDNRHLYKLQPGKEAELLDDSIKVETMNLKNGILSIKWHLEFSLFLILMEIF